MAVRDMAATSRWLSLLLALTACGSVGAYHGGSTYSASPSLAEGPQASPTERTPFPPESATPGSPISGTLTLTNADTGRTLSVYVGTTIRVRLATDDVPGSQWTVPSASSDSIVVRTTGSGGSTAAATFSAKAAGTARLSAVDNPPTCTPACGRPGEVWRVTIVVIA
jgi:hypothetical protein